MMMYWIFMRCYGEVDCRKKLAWLDLAMDVPRAEAALLATVCGWSANVPLFQLVLSAVAG